jgi:uncharacterized membrane protein
MFTRITSVVMLITLVCISVVSALATTAGAVPATQVTYPEQTFANGKAQHFTYKTEDGVSIRYFILKSADGVIRAAFDACNVCWPANKGYSQKGDVMVCNNCGRQFLSTRINEVHGGCNPAALNRKVERGTVVINVADLLKGKRYFYFRGGTR